MLKEIFIEDYKSLKNTKVSFRDGLNIIIGKNGSGKSNLLEFIDKNIGIKPFLPLPEPNRKYPEYNFEYTFRYLNQLNEFNIRITSEKKNTHSRTPQSNIFISTKDLETGESIELEQYGLSDRFDSMQVITQLMKIPQLNSQLVYFDLPEFIYWLDNPHTFTFSPTGVEDDDSYFIDGDTDSFFFFKNFSNTLFVKEIKKSDDKLIQAKFIIIQAFKKYVDDLNINNILKTFSPVQEIKIGQNINIYNVGDKIICENLIIEFRINNAWVPWSYLSDGTRRLFYIITTVCSYDDGIILIEEPELGIHPHQLYDLMSFLKEQSESKQIIISTHSPLVLDTLPANELDRIIIAKTVDGKSQFEHLTLEQADTAKTYIHEVGNLSAYWLHSDLEE